MALSLLKKLGLTADVAVNGLKALEAIGGPKAEDYADDLRVTWRMLVPDEAMGETVTWTSGPVTFEVVPARAAQHYAVSVRFI